MKNLNDARRRALPLQFHSEQERSHNFGKGSANVCVRALYLIAVIET